MSRSLSTPLALIAHEKLTSRFEHAFPEGKEGRVQIVPGGTVEGGLCLTDIDDGTGLDRNPAEWGGQGCRLIRDLADTVGGRAEWHSHLLRGTILTVIVPASSRALPGQPLGP